MRILRPEFLYLFFLFPLILLVLFVGLKSKFGIKRLWQESKLKDISRFSSKGKSILICCLAVLMLISIIFSLSRPQLSYEKKIVVKKPLNILCLVDLSKSMNTRDVFWQEKRVFRLDLVKEELRNFVKNQIGKDRNELALIAFGCNAIYRSFFTYDIGYLMFHIDYLSTDDFPPEGTDIGGAIKRGLEMLDTINNEPEIFNRPKNKKVFVLISDGEDFGENLEQVIAEIRARGISVYTVGVGSRRGGDIIEKIDEQGRVIYFKDEEGKKIYSRLEEKTLKRIAGATGGKYVYSKSGEDLSRAFKDVLEKESEKERKIEKTYYDIYHYLLGFAFILCLIIIILKQN